MNRLLVPVVGAIAVFGLAACSTDSSDFQSDAEDMIEDDDSSLAIATGHTFDDAACDRPENTREGTTYACTAVDDEGDTWDFTMEITGNRGYSALGYHSKYLAEKVLLPSLQLLGTVDEACVDTQVSELSDDEIRARINDAVTNEQATAASQALFDRIATNCVS